MATSKTEENHKTIYARLKAKGAALRGGVRNPRLAKTPLGWSFSKKSKPKKTGVA
jgi:hypothetical protein